MQFSHVIFDELLTTLARGTASDALLHQSFRSLVHVADVYVHRRWLAGNRSVGLIRASGEGRCVLERRVHRTGTGPTTGRFSPILASYVRYRFNITASSGRPAAREIILQWLNLKAGVRCAPGVLRS